MIWIVCDYNSSYTGWGLEVKRHIFLHIHFALTMTVDIFVRRRVVEGNAIRPNADDRAVNIVEFFDSRYDTAANDIADIWNICCSERSRAGEIAEWMEVEIVNCVADGVDQGKLRRVSVGDVLACTKTSTYR
jgi:hypothetical protein